MIIDVLRQYRMGPFAIFDFVAAYLGILLLTPLIKKLFLRFHFQITTASILWLVLPLSIIIHILIGEYTALTKMFLDPFHFYTVKVIVVMMTVKGVWGIRRQVVG